MKIKKRLLGNAFSAAFQTVASAVLLFFLYRFLFRELGPQRLGIWAVVLASTSIGRLTDMGLAGTSLKFVARSLTDGDVIKAQRFLQTAAISISVSLCCVAIVAIPLLKLVLVWALPGTAVPAAMEVLPFAFGSLLLSMISGIFQSGIDACHRMYVKNALLLSANLGYFAITVLLVPAYGLLGVAFAQLAQSTFLLMGSWIILRRLLPGFPLLPHFWGKAEFMEMIGYATNFQIGMIAGLLFDPATKILLSKFGDLTVTAFYEMANQLVQKARAVVVSAQQALVPEIATIPTEGHTDRKNIFIDSYGLSFLVIVPYYIALALSLPFISWIWMGQYTHTFVLFGTLICAGWFSAGLSTVSYFYNLGTAELGWNTFSHVLSGALNLCLGTLLGMLYSSVGVVVAAMLALVVPNVILNFIVLHRLGIDWREVVPAAHRRYLCVFTIGALCILTVAIELNLFIKSAITSILPVLGLVALSPFAILADPNGRKLLTYLRRRVRA
jgi:O-antigen/teichoic acid export membrane protein